MRRSTYALAVAIAPATLAQQPPPLPRLDPLQETRTIDGTQNNHANPLWGSTDVPFRRVLRIGYEDGVDAPRTRGLASARWISNAVAAEESEVPNPEGASDFVWQWGQFLDHDIDLTPVHDPPESFDIRIPRGDVWFDPDGTGTVVMPLERSFYEVVGGVREQVNEITAFIDASNVYGSDATRAVELRTLDGTGRLKTSAGGLLPFNTAGLPNAPTSLDPSFFLAGDFRANEQVGLTAMHVLFVREHNFWADRICEQRGREGPGNGQGGAGPGGARPRRGQGRQPLTGDEIYELARAIVGAEMQVITYREFLPALLGPGAIAPYAGYREDIDPGIANAFAGAAYRFGHSMLPSQLLRLRANGNPIGAGNLALADAFFAPDEILAHGIEPLLRGLATQRAQNIDVRITDGVRNFLFGPPGAGGFDLASLNIQRGRDHGLPSYNDARRDLGLPARTSFAGISSDPEVQARLAAAYRSVEDVDLWVGGLAEDHLPGALVGETVGRILKEQFEVLRDGDRFWYEHALPRKLRDLVANQTLSRIVRRNTQIGSELPQNVFRVSQQ
ncbi:MAG: peroxiredoxin [bacterium]|nr:peroxiredoxin [bacterium]